MRATNQLYKLWNTQFNSYLLFFLVFLFFFFFFFFSTFYKIIRLRSEHSHAKYFLKRCPSWNIYLFRYTIKDTYRLNTKYMYIYIYRIEIIINVLLEIGKYYSRLDIFHPILQLLSVTQYIRGSKIFRYIVYILKEKFLQ